MKQQASKAHCRVATTSGCVRALLEALPQPVVLIDRTLTIVDVNDSLCRLYRKPREALVGQRKSTLLDAASSRRVAAEHRRVFETGEDLVSEETCVTSDGREGLFLSRRRLIDLNGEPMVLTILTDMTERREIEARNRYLSLHDPLTGLANRTLLGERLRIAIDRSDATRPALIFVDLDHFKDVNDAFGHPAGDALLRSFADRLSALVRGSDTVARIGGDEFAVLVSDGGCDAALEALCRAILAAAAQSVEIPGGSVTIGASVGCARADADVDPDELHRRADVAVYEAKREGRGCFRMFDAALGERLRERRALEKDLRAAIAAGDQFDVHYQPVVEFSGNRLVGMEALVRWRHPERGLLMPGTFIGIAEETGLIVPLGEQVLAQAARTMAAFPGVPIAVNLSPVQLRSPGMDSRILEILKAEGLPPGQLQLEITETAMLAVDQPVRDTLARLRCEGVQLVLDDFGTGYSSLSHLHRLAVDRVKIDQSFVRELGTSQDARAIIQAVLGIGHSLGIGVTAEGVEQDAQRVFLRAFGCNEFQGYLFSRPLAHDDAVAFMVRAQEADRRAA